MNQGKILNVRIGTQTLSVDIQPAATVTQDNAGKINELEAKAKIDNLPPGSYYFGFPLHACAYIKVHSSLGYFFDPNTGIYEIQTPSQGEQVFTFFRSAYLKPGLTTYIYPFQNCA